MGDRERRSKSESKGIIHRLVLGRVVQLLLVPLQEVAPEAQQLHRVCNLFPILFLLASSMDFEGSSVVLEIPIMDETTLLQCPRSKRTARSASHWPVQHTHVTLLINLRYCCACGSWTYSCKVACCRTNSTSRNRRGSTNYG